MELNYLSWLNPELYTFALIVVRSILNGKGNVTLVVNGTAYRRNSLPEAMPENQNLPNPAERLVVHKLFPSEKYRLMRSLE
jgi:hypothetical protein